MRAKSRHGGGLQTGIFENTSNSTMNMLSSQEMASVSSSGTVFARPGTPRISFYEHQTKAMECLDRINELPSFSTLVVLPTGGGKTLTVTVWLLRNAIGKAVKVLWLAHRQMLLDQAATAFIQNAYEAYLPRVPSFRYRIVSGAPGHSRAIDIRPDDTLLIVGKDSIGQNLDVLEKWLAGAETVFVVVDEAHHATAKTYRRILDCVAKHVPNVKTIGLTATPMRTAKEEAGLLSKIFRDGIKNGCVLRGDVGIAYQVSLKELIGKQILARPNLGEPVSTEIDFGESLGLDALDRIQRLDMLPDDIAENMAKNAGRNKLIVDTYLQNRQKYGQTIVFALNRNHAYHLRALFAQAGVKAGIVVSAFRDCGTGASFDRRENDRVIAEYKDGKLDVLINVNILTEGVDLPKTKSVFLARPTVSKILMTQMVGRALRGVKAGGTPEANIVSFIDNWHDRLNWVNPESVFEEGGADFTDDARERFKCNLRWISIAKIEEFARMLDSSINTADLDKLPFVERIPIGMYVFSYQEKGDADEDGADCQAQVMVYNSTREAYAKFMDELPALFLRHPGADAEYLPEVLLQKMVDECEVQFFSADMVPPYDRHDIERVLKFFAQKETIPPFYGFDAIDRARLDISQIARKIIDEDMGARREQEYLNGLWDEGDDNLFRLFFTRKIFFISQVHNEKAKLQYPELFASEKSFVEPDVVSHEDLKLDKKAKLQHPDLSISGKSIVEPDMASHEYPIPDKVREADSQLAELKAAVDAAKAALAAAKAARKAIPRETLADLDTRQGLFARLWTRGLTYHGEDGRPLSVEEMREAVAKWNAERPEATREADSALADEIASQKLARAKASKGRGRGKGDRSGDLFSPFRPVHEVRIRDSKREKAIREATTMFMAAIGRPPTDEEVEKILNARKTV